MGTSCCLKEAAERIDISAIDKASMGGWCCVREAAKEWMNYLWTNFGGAWLYYAAGIVAAIYLVSRILERSFDYRDKHVIVTGGSSGIGLELARIYLKKGARVTLVARNKKKLADARAELEFSIEQGQLAPRIHTVSVDVSAGLKEVAEAFAPALQAMGPADVLVNLHHFLAAHSAPYLCCFLLLSLRL